MPNQRIRIRLKAFYHKFIDQSTAEIVLSANCTGAQVSGPIPLPTRNDPYTVLLSPPVNNAVRDQYEIRSHKRLVDIIQPTDYTVASLILLVLVVAVFCLCCCCLLLVLLFLGLLL